MAAATQPEALYFNPWDESFRADPYAHYGPLVSSPPQLIGGFVPMAVVGRYADVVTILHDHERFSSIPPMNAFVQERVSLFSKAPRLVFSDPPVHTRLRRLVSKAFTPRTIREMATRIREITGALLDQAALKGEFEVMADLAVPLPVMVIAEMLGVPSQQYATFKHWSDIIIDAQNIPPGMPLTDNVREAYAALRNYFIEEIDRRRREPGKDLVSLLVAAREEADALSEEELIAFVILLLLAGNETTTNLIGNGMLALGRHPGQTERLRAEPALMPRAIEEMLRYDPPVQSVLRNPKIEVEISGVRLVPDKFVFVVLAAANRDPAKFPNPAVFDITRDPNEHLAFGDGIHYCIGGPLARLEGSIAVASVLERFPKLRLADPEAAPKYKGSYFLRGLASLRMAIR